VVLDSAHYPQVVAGLQRNKINQKAEDDSAIYRFKQTNAIKDMFENGVPKDDKEKVLNLKSSLDYISNQFDKAKTLTGASATAGTLMSSIGIPGLSTEKSRELEAIPTALSLHIDKVTTREMGEKVRPLTNLLAPSWRDTPETLERKKADYLKLVQSLAKAPSSAEGNAVVNELMQTYTAPSGGASAATKAPLSREAAIAELRRRGKI